MKAIALTMPIARAIATDTANRQMRKRCGATNAPHRWNLDDYNLAAQTLADLMGYCVECGRTLPEHASTCDVLNRKEK